MEIENRTIALLIDSENISQKYFTILMDELNKFGDVTYRRIYGDFTKASGWRDLLLQFAIEPMQQYSCTTGKNSSDAAMIIDAMDILYKGNTDCICLATSDSDFTKLATRFRNEGYVVIGAGEEKTPSSFRVACHRFLLMDVLLKDIKKEAPAVSKLEKEKPVKKVAKAAKEQLPIADSILISLRRLVDIAKDIVESNAESDGWMHLATFMNELYKRENAFNPKNYGYPNSKPSSFFKDVTEDKKPVFILEREKNIDRIKINK
ncbi:MAG: NYN domain-containing protein [Methanomassiliicoccaceae archaeon]|nr:NYN domain-containing protein [Methanomassiliicoccaceae archaeon]